MIIPKKFMLKGKEWKVYYRRLDDTHDGLCDFAKRQILLKKDLEPTCCRQVLLHELVHAALFEAHLSGTAGIDVVEEIICDSIADMVDTLFDIEFKAKNGGGKK